jgi:hypothetical protein
LRDFVKREVGRLRVGGARFVVAAAALIDHRSMVCHWPGALSKRSPISGDSGKLSVRQGYR